MTRQAFARPYASQSVPEFSPRQALSLPLVFYRRVSILGILRSLFDLKHEKCVISLRESFVDIAWTSGA
jgi:hypothetical protein